MEITTCQSGSYVSTKNLVVLNRWNIPADSADELGLRARLRINYLSKSFELGNVRITLTLSTETT